jgi:hypothetical protein
MSYQYHPDKAINDEVKRDVIAAEVFDLSIGYPASWWRCPCGASHNRGHFQSIGVHRCLRCGYVGDDGIMAHSQEELDEKACENTVKAVRAKRDGNPAD